MNNCFVWLLAVLTLATLVTCNEADDLQDSSHSRFVRASPLRWGKRAGNNILRWGKRSAADEDEEGHTRDRREAPLRWGKRMDHLADLLDELEKRAPLRWGKRAPVRFGKRGPSRFGKRSDQDEELLHALENELQYEEALIQAGDK